MAAAGTKEQRGVSSDNNLPPGGDPQSLGPRGHRAHVGEQRFVHDGVAAGVVEADTARTRIALLPAIVDYVIDDEVLEEVG